jgi:hypothetical protein
VLPRPERDLRGQLQRHLLRSAAALLVVAGPRVIDEDSSHGARRHGEEVGAILPLNAIEVDETEIRLVDEGSRLQGMPVALASQA